MSLLLDALKKAALEKQKRDQSGSAGKPVGEEEPTAPIQTIDLVDDTEETVDTSAVTQIIALENHEPATPLALSTDSDLGELIDDNHRASPHEKTIPSPALEIQESALELTKQEDVTPTASLSLSSPNGDSQNHDDDNENNDDYSENSIELSLQTNDDSTPPPSANQNDASDTAKSELSATTTDRTAISESSGDDAPEPEDDPPNKNNDGKENKKAPLAPSQFSDAEAKAAMAQLLDSGRKTAKKQSIRSFVSLLALFVTAIGVVALYYYYLQDDGDSQFNIPDNAFEAASENQMLTEDMEVDSLNEIDPQKETDSQVEIADTDATEETSTTDEDPNTSKDAALISQSETSIQTDTSALAEAPTTNNLQKAVADSTPAASSSTKTTPENKRITKDDWNKRLADGRKDKPSTMESAPKTSKSSEQVSVSTASDTRPIKKPSTVMPSEVPATLSTHAEKASTQKKELTQSSSRQLSIQRNNPIESPLSIAIQQGYLAYQNGEFDKARVAYDEALRLSPHHRDALLGAAAVAVREKRYEQALRWYQARLNRAPKDDHAKTGLMALAATQNPGPELVSEVNSLLHDFPHAAHLHFLKGSLSAARKQWGAAQSAFFEATQLDRQNPDYTYNLAISLDHLRQPKDALRYYQQALNISEYRQASFNQEAIRKRIAALEGSVK